MVTDSPLLTTKLHIPRAKRNLISRPHLIQQIHQGMELKLTLVSAPAGSGKTTLLSEWCAFVSEQGHNVAWISLEEGDNDHVRFIRYLAAALQSVCPDIESVVQALLDSPQPPPMEVVMATLINQIAEVPDGFTLVLDDYHMIVAEPIHQLITFLLEHMPAKMHLIIVGRASPPLPLARMRASGEIMELYSSDLRFTPDETNALLQQSFDGNSTSCNAKELEIKTDGWIAGIQLALLSAKSHGDLSRIASIPGGTRRLIFDYLAEEVLYVQLPEIQSFLLQTSILDQLSAPLCHAVTGLEASQQMLYRLERDNLFTISLDDEGQWYRYHHLFRDFLQEQLERRYGEKVLELHTSAIDYYARNGMEPDGIRHALAIEDYERAAELIEQVADYIYRRGEFQTLRTWVEPLPEDLIRSRPRLSIAHAITLYFFGDLALAEERLLDAENTLSAAIKEEAWTEAEARPLLGEVKAYQAFAARAHRNMTSSIELSYQALELLPQDNLNLRSLVYLNLGYLHWINGDLEVARGHFMDASNMGKATGNFLVFLTAVARCSRVLRELGRLSEAAEELNSALVYATEQVADSLPALSNIYTAIARLMRQRNELGEASRYIEDAIKLSQVSGTANMLVTAYIAKARVKQSQGNLDVAAEAMKQAEQLADKANLPRINFALDRTRVYLWLAQGNVDAAQDWADQRGINFDDVIDYPNEDDYIIYSRVLIAQGKNDEAISLLDRLLESTEVGGRTGRVIEILVFKAGALYARSDTEQAVDVLHKAITLAEPEQFIQVFVDMGPPMAALLRHVALQGIAFDFVSKLLSAFDEFKSPTPQVGQPLIEPLSERELEVLRHIVLGMSNSEISEDLIIAISTVKTHVNHIFRKLDVVHRAQAVAKARELDLL